jgi:hypothetical protein
MQSKGNGLMAELIARRRTTHADAALPCHVEEIAQAAAV